MLEQRLMVTGSPYVLMVGEDEKVCACLGRTVRAAGMDRGLLCKEKIRAVQRKISVHFVGGYLMITCDAVFAAGIHQNSGTFDVGIQENLRVFDGAVYVALCCEVHYDVRMLFLKETCKRLHGP